MPRPVLMIGIVTHGFIDVSGEALHHMIIKW